MATSTAKTPDAYVASLPRDRSAEIAAVRAAVNAKIPRGFEEGMIYGMIGWYVPSARLPRTYNGQPFAIACLASQKNYMALYLMSVYGDSPRHKRFIDAYKKSGKKLDMGKACIRFKSADALALDVIGEALSEVSVDRWVEVHDATHGTKAVAARRAARKPTKTRKRSKS
jgi:uncharacterized protein YdhG (YjbR/CyaY superfamily)